MDITHKISLDLQQTGARQVMFAKQGDCLTRIARLLLYDGGTEFTVPSGTIMQIAYAKPDGKGGVYDTMPDGSVSCTVSGNVVTAKLHPQMFSVAGIVACELRLLTGSGAQLTTFSWFITVQASAAEGIVSEDYFRFASLDGLRSDVGDLSKLSTDAKDNLVAAINEVLGKFGELDAANIAANVDGIPDGNVAIALAYLLNVINQLDARDILSQDFGGTVYDVLQDLIGDVVKLRESLLSLNASKIPATFDDVEDVNTVYDALLYLQALAQTYVVNMTKNADGTYTADKTFAELRAAHDAGKTVICSFQDLTRQWDGPVRLPLVYLSDTAMGFAAVVDPEQGYMAYVWAYINSGGMGHTATEIATEEMTEAYVVNMTKNADGTYTADKTFAELKAAHAAGRTVICSFQDLTQQWDGPVRLPVVDTTDVHMGFAGVIEPRQNYKIFAYVYINSSGMGHTATEIATNDTVSTMIAAAIGDTATALSDMDSVIGGAGA